MDPQDLGAALDVGNVDDDLAVEATRPQEGRVQDVGPVGRTEHDDPERAGEAVHLDEQLVEGLLTLVVAATHAGATLAASGVELVDEDDAGGELARLAEQVPHASGAHADQRLHELRAGELHERHHGLAGHRLGQQRLAGAGRPGQQHALRRPRPELGELHRVHEVVHDLLQLHDRLLVAGDVLEGRRALRAPLPALHL